MASVWFVSAAHGRHDTVRVALTQRRHVCDELAKRGFTADGVLVADDENLDIAAEYGFHTVDLGNADVGEKFNAGIRYALNHAADVVAYLGSDNWAHPDLFDQLPGPREVMTGSLIQAVDLPTGRMQLCRIDTTYGVIPWLIPRQLLEPCDGEPLPPGLVRGFDSALIRGLTRANGYPPSFRRFDPHEYARVDFKTPQNLTPYERFTQGFGIGGSGWEALRDWYPHDLVAQARGLEVPP